MKGRINPICKNYNMILKRNSLTNTNRTNRERNSGLTQNSLMNIHLEPACRQEREHNGRQQHTIKRRNENTSGRVSGAERYKAMEVQSYMYTSRTTAAKFLR